MLKQLKDNLLFNLYGKKIIVNSNHQHNITKLAKDVSVLAKSDDNVIEAIEVKNKKFMIGVQWHPEHLIKTNNKMLKLFEKLISAC